jgi:hypothetical protein
MVEPVERALDPTETQPSSATEPESLTHGTTRSKIRRLNIGNGFVPLVTGEGNPLRVGSEVNSIVYVIDKSSSMSGEPFHQVSAALCDVVDSLKKDQKFAVILFDTASHPLGSLNLLSAKDAHKQEMKQNLRGVSANGGTSPFAAVKDALDLNPDAIVLLSDGDFGQFDVTQISQYNHSRSPVTTIHCVGLRRNIQTLRQLSKDNGNGAYTTVDLLPIP